MSEFIDYLHEVFEPLGTISSRRMFGGHGIYHQGVMIGLVADETLYLKADDDTADIFREAGSEPFEFIKNGKPMRMSYFEAPLTVFEDEEEALRYGRLALEAAVRAKNRGKRKS